MASKFHKNLGRKIEVLEKSLGAFAGLTEIQQMDLMSNMISHVEEAERNKAISELEKDGIMRMLKRAKEAPEADKQSIISEAFEELRSKALDHKAKETAARIQREKMDAASRLKHADQGEVLPEETELRMMKEEADRQLEEKVGDAAEELRKETEPQPETGEDPEMRRKYETIRSTPRMGRAYKEYLSQDWGIMPAEIDLDILRGTWKNEGAGKTFEDFYAKWRPEDEVIRLRAHKKLERIRELLDDNSHLGKLYADTDVIEKQLKDQGFSSKKILSRASQLENRILADSKGSKPGSAGGQGAKLPPELAVTEELPKTVRIEKEKAADSNALVKSVRRSEAAAENIDPKDAAAAYRAAMSWVRSVNGIKERSKGGPADRMIDDAMRLMGEVEKYAPQYHKAFLDYRSELGGMGSISDKKAKDRQKRTRDRVLDRLAADISDIQLALYNRLMKAGLTAEQLISVPGPAAEAPEANPAEPSPAPQAETIPAEKEVVAPAPGGMENAPDGLEELRSRYPNLNVSTEGWNNRAKNEFKGRAEQILGLLEEKIGPAVRDMQITVTDVGVASYYPDKALAFSILAPQTPEAVAAALAAAYSAARTPENIGTEANPNPAEAMNAEAAAAPESLEAEKVFELQEELDYARGLYQKYYAALRAALKDIKKDTKRDPESLIREIENAVDGEYGTGEIPGESPFIDSLLKGAGIPLEEANRIYDALWARREYYAARRALRDALLSDKRKELAAENSGAELEAELEKYKSGELFNRIVLGEAEKLVEKKMTEWPPKLQATLRNVFDVYNKVPRGARTAIVALIMTGASYGAAAATMGSSGVGQAALFFGTKFAWKWARGFTAGTIGMGVGLYARKKLGEKRDREFEEKIDSAKTALFAERLESLDGRVTTALRERARTEKLHNAYAIFAAAGASFLAGSAGKFVEDLAAGNFHNAAEAAGPMKPAVRIPENPKLKVPVAEARPGETLPVRPLGIRPDIKPAPLNIPEAAVSKPPEEFMAISTAEKDSIWKMAEEQMHKHYGARFDDLSSAQKTYVLDTVKVRLGGEAQDIIPEGHKVDFSKVLGGEEDMEKLLKRAEGLSKESLARIDANNKAIADWLKAHPHEQLTEAKADAAIRGESGISKVEALPDNEPAPAYLFSEPVAKNIETPESGAPDYLFEGAPQGKIAPEVPPSEAPDYLFSTPKEAPPPDIPDNSSGSEAEGPFETQTGLEDLPRTRIPSSLQRMMLTDPFRREFSSIKNVSVGEFLKHVPTEKELALDSHKPIADAIKAGEYKVAMKVGNAWQYPKITMNHVKLHAELDKLHLADKVKNMDIFSFAKSLRG